MKARERERREASKIFLPHDQLCAPTQASTNFYFQFPTTPIPPHARARTFDPLHPLWTGVGRGLRLYRTASRLCLHLFPSFDLSTGVGKGRASSLTVVSLGCQTHPSHLPQNPSGLLYIYIQTDTYTQSFQRVEGSCYFW